MCSARYHLNKPLLSDGTPDESYVQSRTASLPRSITHTSSFQTRYILHSQTKQKACHSNMIFKTTTKTNSIYPTSIQIKTQSNCLLIRHVSATHFHKTFYMNFCHNASSWSQSNRSMTQNKPTLAQLCLKTWSLYCFL